MLTVAVQTNLNEMFTDDVFRACKNNPDLNYVGFTLIPFSYELTLPDTIQEPFVLFGSTTLNRLAEKHPVYSKGIFFDSEQFTPEMYNKHYGDNYLNHDMQTFEVSSIPDDLYPLDTEVFVRSNDDSKQIPGGTCTFSELLDIKRNTTIADSLYAGNLFNSKSSVCIASSKPVEYEFRIVFVGGELVDASMYRPHVSDYIPHTVIEFANRMRGIWQPHKVFVMDVCYVEGDLKVVECNCFNCCGFYACSVPMILYAIHSYMNR